MSISYYIEKNELVCFNKWWLFNYICYIITERQFVMLRRRMLRRKMLDLNDCWFGMSLNVSMREICATKRTYIYCPFSNVHCIFVYFSPILWKTNNYFCRQLVWTNKHSWYKKNNKRKWERGRASRQERKYSVWCDVLLFQKSKKIKILAAMWFPRKLIFTTLKFKPR